MIPFPFAPITRLVDWWTRDDLWAYMARNVPSKLGVAMLEEARKELGNGEQGGNNQGPHIDRYRSALGEGIGGKGSWCAALQCWLAVEACGRIKWALPFELSHGARRLVKNMVKAKGARLVKFAEIQPGDILLFDRGDPKRPKERWKAHIAITSSVRWLDGKVGPVEFIDGNAGKYPSVVTERQLTKARKRKLIAIVRLP